MPEYYSTTEVVALGAELGRGGEGTVFQVLDKPDLVAKIYHKPISAEKTEKLRQMVALQNEKILRIAAWITDVLRDKPGGRVVGFLMPRLHAEAPIHELYNPQSRRKLFPSADWRFLIHAATNLARAFAVIHHNGHAVGDVNHGNVVIERDATIRLIDCDSYQLNAFGKSYLCEVGVSTHTPPELQNRSLRGIERTSNHDAFGLAVIIFQLLFLGRHPFSGAFQGTGENTLEDSIRNRRFAYGDGARTRGMKQPPGTLSLAAVPLKTAQLFERAFLEIENRPAAHEWVGALKELEQTLSQCQVNAGHYYLSTLEKCPWCKLENQTSVMFFPAKYTGNFDPNGEFDLYTLGHLIDHIKPPQLSQNLPVTTQNLLFHGKNSSISPALAETLTNYRSTLVVFLAITAILVFVCGYVFGFGSIFWMGFAGFWVMNAILKAILQNPQESAQSQLDSAHENWQSFKEEWSKTTLAKPFEAARHELKEKIKEYRELPGKKEVKLREIEAQTYQQRLEFYLDGFVLKNAEIFGLNDERLNLLNVNGIKTAAQIDNATLAQIPHFSHSHKRILLEWRHDLEKKYVFTPSLSLIKENTSKVESEIYVRRAQLETDLSGGLNGLQEISLQLTKKHGDLTAQSNKLAVQLARAESDFKSVEELKNQAIVWMIAVVLISFVTGIVIRQLHYNERYLSRPVAEQSSGGSVKRDDKNTVTAVNEVREVQTVPQSVTPGYAHENWGKAGELFQAGEAYFAARKYQEAVAAYKEAARANPRIAEIFNKMGEAYFQLAQNEQAVEAYQKALKIKPTDSDTLHKLGMIYNKMNRTEDAISSFKRAVENNPNATDLSRYELGLCYIKTGSYNLAGLQYQMLDASHSPFAEKLWDELKAARR